METSLTTSAPVPSIAVHSHGDLTPAEIAHYYSVRAPHVKQRGAEWRGPCPIHHGKDDNFAVNAETGLWKCFSQCNVGGSVYDLEMALANTDFPTAARAVRRTMGRPESQQSQTEPAMKWGLPGYSHQFLAERIADTERKNGWKHTAIYPYFRQDGALSYVKVRFVDKQNDKTFRQWAITKPLGWATRKKAKAEPLL